jgi:hypothetical protein
MSKSSGLSSGGEIQRVINAARSPEWSVGEGQKGQIMATHDSGEIGSPWVITAVRGGRGMRVFFYRPGDDVHLEGEAIGEITGNPREMGRQLRGFLEDAPLD